MENNYKKLYKEALKFSTPKRELTKYATAGAVSCALLTKTGKMYTGICLNVCGGIGFCAEHSAVAEMLKYGESQIQEILSIKNDRDNQPVSPCGRCRELMLQIDLNNKDTLVYVAPNEAFKLSELMPHHWMRP